MGFEIFVDLSIVSISLRLLLKIFQGKVRVVAAWAPSRDRGYTSKRFVITRSENSYETNFRNSKQLPALSPCPSDHWHLATNLMYIMQNK